MSALTDEPKICLERMIKRNRNGESTVKIDYLKDLTQKTSIFYNNWNGPKLRLRTDSSFESYIPFIISFIEYYVKMFIKHDDDDDQNFKMSIN